jgi:hypothetical protein
MKRFKKMFLLAVVLIPFSLPLMCQAKGPLVIEELDLVSRGFKVRVQTTEWTKSIEVEKTASVMFSINGVRVIIDGQIIGDCVWPKTLPTLEKDEIVDGVITNLTFYYYDEKAMISFDSGHIWTNMAAKARFFVRDNIIFIKFLRSRFGTGYNKGVRTFQIKE